MKSGKKNLNNLLMILKNGKKTYDEFDEWLEKNK